MRRCDVAIGHTDELIERQRVCQRMRDTDVIALGHEGFIDRDVFNLEKAECAEI